MTDDNLQTDLAVTAEINLYYDLYVPENLPKTAPLLIAVHGYGAHKRYMMREAKLVAPDNFAIAAIQAPHPHFRPTPDGYRVGYGWLSDQKSEEYVRLHHKFVLDVIAKLAGDGLIDEQRIYIYGFSQACALDFRFAFTYPEILAGVIGKRDDEALFGKQLGGYPGAGIHHYRIDQESIPHAIQKRVSICPKIS